MCLDRHGFPSVWWDGRCRGGGMLLRAKTAFAALMLAASAGGALAQLFPQLPPPVEVQPAFRPLPPVVVENENLPPYDPPPGYGRQAPPQGQPPRTYEPHALPP